MRRRPGIKGRLDQLQGKASQTMDVAQQVLLRLEAKADGAIDELLDGVRLKLTIAGRDIPIELKILPREEEDRTKE